MLPESLRGLSRVSLKDPMPLWQKAHSTRRAAVSVILSPSAEQELQVLLTVRSRDLSYAGDVAFPGGKVDDAIESPWDAAVRETEEEVGIKASTLQFVRTLPGYVSSRQMIVVPTVMWSEKAPCTQQLANAEVYKVFNSPLSEFLKAERHHYRTVEWKKGKNISLSHFDIIPSKKQVGDPPFDKVWGLTVNILIDCGKLIYMKEPEFAFKRGRSPTLQDLEEIGNQSILESLAAQGILQTPLPPRRKSE